MELTRRDAAAALAAAGVALGGPTAVKLFSDGETADEATGPLTEHDRATLVAAAELVYPSEVTEIETFVEQFVDGRASERPAHAAGVHDAIAALDDYSDAWLDDTFLGLEPAGREESLRLMGVDTAAADPDGIEAERVRYYVVNELLFALYSSPTGGSLLGIENPPGHPGGLSSYQRGPS